jgi:hypothetical protein
MRPAKGSDHPLHEGSYIFKAFFIYLFKFKEVLVYFPGQWFIFEFSYKILVREIYYLSI